nr:zinc transporter ZntB [Pseudomonas aeruginosa]
VEELVEADERASPDQHQLRTLRRRSAGLGGGRGPPRALPAPT